MGCNDLCCAQLTPLHPFLFLADYSLITHSLEEVVGLASFAGSSYQAPQGDVHGKRFAAESALAVSFAPSLRKLIFADGHTVSNAPDLF